MSEQKNPSKLSYNDAGFVDVDKLLESILRLRARMEEKELVELKKIDPEGFVVKLSDEFPEFESKPYIFTKVVRGESLEWLPMFLAQIDHVRTQSKTKEEAETEVYGTLKNEYLDPMIERLNRENGVKK